MSQADKTRAALLEWMAGKGWVSIYDISKYLNGTFGTNRSQGQGDLRALMLAGLIEKRQNPTRKNKIGHPSSDYRLCEDATWREVAQRVTLELSSVKGGPEEVAQIASRLLALAEGS